jgi:hypothetical protein
VITWGAGFATITDNTAGRDGVDTLYGVEHVRFSDGGVMNLTPPASGLAALFANPAETPAAGPHAAGVGQLPVWEDLF